MRTTTNIFNWLILFDHLLQFVWEWKVALGDPHRLLQRIPMPSNQKLPNPFSSYLHFAPSQDLFDLIRRFGHRLYLLRLQVDRATP